MMRTDEMIESETRPEITQEEADRRFSEYVLGRIKWGYKSDTVVLVPKTAKVGDWVMIESADLGLEGVKISKILSINEEKGHSISYMGAFDLTNALASEEEIKTVGKNKELAKEIARFTQEQSDKYSLNMKVLEAYLSFDKHKVLIEYTSEGRVDFRELLKILASRFHVRIEFRQLFPRDVAKRIGGIGICGLPVCCKAFLTSFTSVTINMAKNQYLSLNIPKLSGVCGRLMCCLAYENDAYSQLKPYYPKQGATATINGHAFRVVSLNVLSDSITATDGDTYQNFTSAEWMKATGTQPNIETVKP